MPCVAVVWWLSLLHNFIHHCLNSGSAQVQILLAVHQRFAMVRISDKVLARNKAKCLSSINHTTKTNYHHHHNPRHCRVPGLNGRTSHIFIFTNLTYPSFLVIGQDFCIWYTENLSFYTTLIVVEYTI